MNVPTPHIAAKQGDFAKTVIMPGDPLRVKFIAENFLEDAVLVTSVRGILGYTGTYEGKRVSVMASGMGVPSMGIYSYELFNFYDVDTIIRIGSAGAIHESLQLKDIVVGQAVCTDSNFAAQFELGGSFAPIGDFGLIMDTVKVGAEIDAHVVVGNILCSDVFYSDTRGLEKWGGMGVLAVEMESTALYLNAAKAGKKALCMCTISDCPLRNESLSSEERQNGFTQMMKLALTIAKE